MNALIRFFAATFVVCLATFAFAGSFLRPTHLVISAENVHRLVSSEDFQQRVDRIVIGPARGELAFLDWRGELTIVDDAAFRPLRKIAEGKAPNDFAASRDGRFIAWHERDSKTYIVQATDSGKTVEFEAGKRPGYAKFSPDGKYLAIGDAVEVCTDIDEGFCEMKIWDTTGKLLRTLAGAKQGGLTPVFSPDGKVLAVGNRNHETRLFDVESGKMLHQLPRRMTHELAFSPDGKSLVASYVDGRIGLWDVDSGKLLKLTETGCQEIYSVDFSPNGELLATSGRDGNIVLWNSKTLEKLKELDAPSWVIQVRFTADGTRLLSSGSTTISNVPTRKVSIWTIQVF